MNKDIESIIVTSEEIAEICKRLGQRITNDYKGKEIVLIGLLNGSVPFMASLMMEIDLPIQTEYMQASSYHGGTSSSMLVQIKKDLDYNISGKDVLIVEDIVDTGATLQAIIELLNNRGAKSVEIACLLDKPTGRKVQGINPKYIGTEVGNQFVVGFGLDYDERYRNLKYVGILKQEVYKK